MHLRGLLTFFVIFFGVILVTDFKVGVLASDEPSVERSLLNLIGVASSLIAFGMWTKLADFNLIRIVSI